MGVYDHYGEEAVQLKVGPCELKQYNVGDKVDIRDGVYIGWEGIVVIHEGKLLHVYPCLITKYGEELYPGDVMRNLLEEALRGLEDGVQNEEQKTSTEADEGED